MEENPTNRRRSPATVAEVNAMRLPGRHSVGDGLILVVNPSGSRSWLARIRDPQGKRRDIGLGRYPEVSLKEAREHAATMRRQVRAQLDPVAVKRKAKNAMPTFAQAAEVVFEDRTYSFRNVKHRQDWIRSLREYAYPTLGNVDLDKVTNPMIVQAMKSIWLTKPETARRVLQRIGVVISWATAHGFREHEASMNAVRMGLPPQPKRVDENGKHHATPKHHAAVGYADAPSLYHDLCQREDSIARRCLRLIILTAVRSNEARGARWAEFNFDQETWTIPADRMKRNVEHVVPLSKPAIALLKEMNESRSSEQLFEVIPNGRRKSKEPLPISDSGVRKAMIDIAPGFTVHGWRSTFRDWVSEETNVPSEVAEKALAHQIPNAVERAYRRGDLLEKRRQLMAAWANFLKGTAADVRQIGRAA